jgi:alpha-glucosidase
MDELKAQLKKYVEEDPETLPVEELGEKVGSLANSPKDYKRFYHQVNGERIRHDYVHNLFGYNMTRAAGEAFDRIDPDKRFLIFSRSSYIGMHRYGGIWTGDNKSWWSHILLNLKMMPSLNMCGFLYTGADLGGFGSDATRDLVLRWLALGVFTPLMRNHAALGTREQECYQFENIEDFRGVIETRYRLIPYLYSEYMKAALNDDMYFKPLAFVYPDDSFAVTVEDQMMLGNEIMIAPVYTQNAKGRYVYLPEEMLFVKFSKDGQLTQEVLEKGHHYIEVALNEVPMFIRSGKCIPLADAAQSVEELNTEKLTMIGYEGAQYTLYEDDGTHKDYDNAANYKTLRK